MMLTIIELFLFCYIPLTMGRVMDASTSSQELRKNNKIFLHNKDSSKRALRPSLSIHKAPKEMLEIMTGDSKYLECEAGGTPPPSIHWLKDGQRIPQNMYEAIHPNGGHSDVLESNLGLGFTRSRFLLDCATSSDAGRYTCVAENDFIRTFKSSQVFVADIMAAENEEEMCVAKKAFGSPAHIHMWTKTRLELMGSDVQLFCRASGDPQPHVTWRGPSKKTLNDSKKYEVLPNGDLIIRKLAWSDMGGYSCQAENSEGSDGTVTFLYPTLPDSGNDV